MNRAATQRTTHRTAAAPHRGPSTAQQHSRASRYVRRGISSGLFAAVAGLVSLGRVRRALREESSEQAVQRALLAVFWIGTALTQWGLNRSKYPRS